MDCAGSLGFVIYLHACGLTREPERKTFGADIGTSPSNFGLILARPYRLSLDSVGLVHP